MAVQPAALISKPFAVSTVLVSVHWVADLNVLPISNSILIPRHESNSVNKAVLETKLVVVNLHTGVDVGCQRGVGPLDVEGGLCWMVLAKDLHFARNLLGAGVNPAKAYRVGGHLCKWHGISIRLQGVRGNKEAGKSCTRNRPLIARNWRESNASRPHQAAGQAYHLSHDCSDIGVGDVARAVVPVNEQFGILHRQQWGGERSYGRLGVASVSRPQGWRVQMLLSLSSSPRASKLISSQGTETEGDAGCKKGEKP